MQEPQSLTARSVLISFFSDLSFFNVKELLYFDTDLIAQQGKVSEYIGAVIFKDGPMR